MLEQKVTKIMKRFKVHLRKKGISIKSNWQLFSSSHFKKSHLMLINHEFSRQLQEIDPGGMSLGSDTHGLGWWCCPAWLRPAANYVVTLLFPQLSLYHNDSYHSFSISGKLYTNLVISLYYIFIYLHFLDLWKFPCEQTIRCPIKKIFWIFNSFSESLKTNLVQLGEIPVCLAG